METPKGTVIQIAPEYEYPPFRYCFAVVEEGGPTAVRAYILLPSEDGTPATKAIIPHRQYCIIGKAAYVMDTEIPF